MATFLGYLMLKEGYKKGKKFTYHAVAEEDAAVQTGEAFIEGNESYKSIDTFKIFNTFKNSKFISFVTHSGEVLATRSPIQNLATELVATPAEATAGHNVNEGHLKKIFGDVPKGKTHALAKAAAPTAAPTVTPAAPAQPDQPKPKGP